MEHLIKDLIEQISIRKKNEMAWFEKYKNEELKDLMLISSGKVMEMDHLIRQLKEMIKYKLKRKNY
ncbi:MAG: hypothetical protein Q8R96_16575 [Bacteroidota bacterium]|nr:hypothetical protein [Bacteroidota bacterium]